MLDQNPLTDHTGGVQKGRQQIVRVQIYQMAVPSSKASKTVAGRCHELLIMGNEGDKRESLAV
jgi:hypothetical protein